MRLQLSHGLLALSLVANVGLAWHLYSAKPRHTEKESSAESTTASLLGARQTPPPSSWTQMESASPGRLTAQLRAIGCPEEFIRNAAAAAINRDFAKRAAGLRSLDTFWNTPTERETAENERNRQLWELDQERHDALEETTGIRSAPTRNWYGIKSAAISALQFGFVAPERHEQLIEFVTDMDGQARHLQEAAGALGDEEAMSQRQALYAQYDAFMNRHLSADERFKSESFLYDMYLFDVWSATQLFGRKLDPDECLTMLKLLMPPDFVQKEMFELPLDSYNDAELQEERQEQIRETFGEDMLNHFRETSQKRGLANIAFPPGSSK